MIEWRRVLRFAAVGGMSTSVHVVVAFSLISVWGYLDAIANGCAYGVATLFSYTANASWTFAGRLSPGSLWRFVSVSLFGLCLSMGVSHAAMICGVPALGGIALVVLVVPPLTYALHARWTFSKSTR